MIIVGIIGGIFLGLGGYGNRLVGVICLQLFILFDCVDGEIARYRKQTSIKGAYLDLVANDISHISIFIGLTIGLLKYPDIFFRILGMHKEAIVILGIGCVIFPLLNRTAIAYLSEAGAKPADLSKVVLKDKKAKSLKSCLLFLHEPIHVINVIAVAALLDVSSLALIGYGIFFPLWWFVSVIVRFRKI